VRIASLLSSTTEIVCRLGLADQLVGVTFECDWPAGVRDGREILVHGIETAGLTSGEIDAAVRAAAEAGTPLYQLDETAFDRCSPDLVLTQDLCRVCALPAGDVDTALAHLGCTAKVVSHDPHTLADVLTSIAAIAHAAGVADRGAQFVRDLKKRLANVRASVSGVEKPSVFVLEWTDPPFLSGHWVPDVIAAAGGRPVLAKAGERSTATTWEAIQAARPDVVLVAPCGFGLDGAVTQASAVLDRLPDRCEVWAIDANALMVRPGPRLVDGVEQLAAALHDIGAPDPTLVQRVR
jgi:iron complex transport system substrate-binding protein